MITPATPEIAAFVAKRLSDNEVCVREYGREDAAALCFETARDSVMSWAVLTDDDLEPVCLFGADGDEGDDWGSAWMFSTGNIGRAKRIEVIRALRKAIAFSRSFWPELRIIAEDRTDKQTRFLKIVGFRESAEDPRELVL